MSTSVSIPVQIPAALRAQTGGAESVETTGSTVGELLASLVAAHPALGAKLFDGEQRLNRFLNVYVNDEDIRFLANLDTPIKAGDDVALIPAIAGG